MELLEKLKQYKNVSDYDCNDIAEKLIELSNLEEDGELCEELMNALYQIKAIAQNPYNADYYRVLYNVLLVVTGFECF